MSRTWEIKALHDTHIWRGPDHDHGTHSAVPKGATIQIAAVVRGVWTDGGDAWGWTSGGEGFVDLTGFQDVTTELPAPAVLSGGWIDGLGPTLAPSSPLVTPALDRERVDSYLRRRGAKLHDSQIELITGFYWSFCNRVGVNLLLAITQMIHETGALTSHWSGQPMYNFAGIGVDGRPGRGVTFGSIDRGVRCHVGRLLAYSLPPDEVQTDAQQELIDEALAARSLSDAVRGKVRTVRGLTSTWAADPDYHTKLSRVARELLEYRER